MSASRVTVSTATRIHAVRSECIAQDGTHFLLTWCGREFSAHSVSDAERPHCLSCFGSIDL